MITQIDPYHEFTEPDDEHVDSPEKYILPYGTDEHAAAKGKLDTGLLLSRAGKILIGFDDSPPPIISATTRINALYAYNGTLTANIQSIGALTGWAKTNLIIMSSSNDVVISDIMTCRIMAIAVQNLDSSNTLGVYVKGTRIARISAGVNWNIGGIDCSFINLGFAGVGASISDCDIRVYLMAGDK